MTEVAVLIDSARVVKEREQGDDFDPGACIGREPSAVLKHASPMDNAVVTPNRQRIVRDDFVNDRGDVHGTLHYFISRCCIRNPRSISG